MGYCLCEIITQNRITLENPMERTLSIIKPDATAKNVVGKIVARFEEEGLNIAAIRKNPHV